MSFKCDLKKNNSFIVKVTLSTSFKFMHKHNNLRNFFFFFLSIKLGCMTVYWEYYAYFIFSRTTPTNHLYFKESPTSCQNLYATFVSASKSDHFYTINALVFCYFFLLKKKTCIDCLNTEWLFSLSLSFFFYIKTLLRA